jgi:hypothetical protein
LFSINNTFSNLRHEGKGFMRFVENAIKYNLEFLKSHKRSTKNWNGNKKDYTALFENF